MSVTTGQKQAKDTRFKPGESGNPKGRPKGSRHKLSEAFIAELCADFHAHGSEVIARVREDRPQDYLRIIASILPKDVNVTAPNPLEALSDEELAAALEVVRRIMAGDDDDGSDSATTTH